MKRLFLRASCASLMAISMAGCVPSTHYMWGSYDEKLYTYYRNPGDSAPYISGLEKTLNDAEARNRVPPGLCAEYGYALLEAGQREQAVANFEKEKRIWPESGYLMDKLIANARSKTKDNSENHKSSEGVAK